ncbi:MAG: metallophosphoesterase family protein [Acidobacteriota bacterium]
MAAIADLHCRVDSATEIRQALDGVDQQADVLLLAGDLTDTDLLEEVEVLIPELHALKIPILAVLGNHDHESDGASKIAETLTHNGIRVLDGTVCEIGEVGFVGTKGFCGGFDERLVQPFGERALKTFIQASIDEAVRLENALTKLDCPRKIAILHYAPVKQTLQGEPEELYPLLGSSRLANALNRHRVDAIVHGHAHHGSRVGRTAGGIPVYNVCRFVLGRAKGRQYLVLDF